MTAPKWTATEARIMGISDPSVEPLRPEDAVVTFHQGLPRRGLEALIQVLQYTWGQTLFLHTTPQEWNCPGYLTLYARGDSIEGAPQDVNVMRLLGQLAVMLESLTRLHEQEPGEPEHE